MPRQRALSGQGTAYKERDRNGRTVWVAELTVTLPNGLKKRVRARARTAEEAVRLRDARANGVRLANPDAERMTVRDLADRWLGARAHELKPSTVVTYRKSLDAYVLPALGEMRVARVMPLDVETMLARVLARATERNSMRAAADRARRVTSAMFEQARRWRLIAENPAAEVAAVRAFERERGYWTRDEAQRFLAVAEGERYAPLFRTALETGLRLGELLALRWGDVEGLSFVVRRTFSSDTGAIQDQPKSAAGRRRVPISSELLQVLGPRRGGAALVFASRSGGVLTPSSVRRAFDRVQAKVPGLPRLKVHDMRRTYASLLAVDGYHPSIIQRLMGHASPDLAMRIYTSVGEATLEGAVVSVGGYVRGSVRGLQGAQGGSDGVEVKGRPGGVRASRTGRVSSGARVRRRAGRDS
jgi:integrase